MLQYNESLASWPPLLPPITHVYSRTQRNPRSTSAHPIPAPALSPIHAPALSAVAVAPTYIISGTNGQVHNAVALFDPAGAIALLYHKVHFAQGYSVNPACYTPGAAFPVAATALGGAMGVMICFDRQLPETARSLRVAGAQLIISPSFGSFSPANTSGQDGWDTRLLRTRAYEKRSRDPCLRHHF